VSGLSAVPAAARHAGAAAPAAVAANQAAKSAVALAVNSAGTGYGFYRGQGDAVYLRNFHVATWGGQTSLGGTIIGAPAAAIAAAWPAFTGTSTVYVAARGTNNAVYMRTLKGGAWGGWTSWGGIVSSAPAIAGATDGRVDVFARGGDGALWTRTMGSNGVLTQWKSLGGQLATAPDAVSSGIGSIDVYATLTDHHVWHTSLLNGTWSAWQSIGGTTYSAPAAGFIPEGMATVVLVRGTNNALYANTNGGGWSGWTSLGGVLIDGPMVTETDQFGLVATVRGTDGAVYTKVLNSTWSAFTRAWTPAAPAPPASSLLGNDWTRIPTTAKVVALTFDAGANAAGVASIESTLRTKNVPATFFLTGSWARGFPAQANLIAAGGFLIGNHSMTHPYFTQLTDAQVTAQVRDAQQAILTTNGADPRPLFRFPYGDVNSRVLKDVNNLGYVPVRWTVDSLGWEGTSGGQSVQSVIDRVLGAVQPGEIVLMHLGSNPADNTTLDASALPKIIDGIRARGYTFVTLRALTG
jgi:peptidoglycan/xylan/chitin deacetylase (PgdA/CDA1 family)